MKKSEIQELRNLGPVSERALNAVGIYTKKDLEKFGAEKAFEMVKEAGFKPSKNLLYAMIGAIHDKSWSEVVAAIRQNSL